MPAWQPILTAGTVLPTFFVIGVAFVAVGAGLFYFSNEVLEYHKDYTDCKSIDDVAKTCAEILSETNDTSSINCKCVETIEVDINMEGPVYMYYGLTNFYQNHRRYVKSRDDSQLLGNIENPPNNDCDPYKTDSNGKNIVPCGAIANSLFSDNIKLTYVGNDTTVTTTPVNLIRKGIAWDSDKRYKFKNPTVPEGQTLEEVLKEKTAKPPEWKKNLWELDTEDEQNNGLQNEDLIVWMRTAAFPNFRKLYRKIDHDGYFKDGLPKGNYTMEIDYNFKVKQFSGTKTIYLSQTSILGGKNPFLGIAYIVVGCICLIMGIVFLVIHLKYGKLNSDLDRLGEMSGR